MEPLEYLKVIVRRWPWVVALALVGAAVGYATAPKPHAQALHVKSYTATYVLALDPTSPAALGSGGVSSSAPSLPSMAFLVTAGQVPVAAAKRLGYPGPPAALVQQLNVIPNTVVSTLQIAAVDADPVRATRIADAFAVSLIDYLATLAQNTQAATLSRLQAALSADQAQVGKLDQQIAQPGNGSPPVEVLQAQRQDYANRYAALFDQYLTAISAPPASSPLVTFQKPVALPTAYASTKSHLPTGKAARAALGGALGLLLAAAVVIAIDLLDPRIRSRAAAERAYGLPVLAELPVVRQSRRGAPAVVRAPASALADAYRVLRAALLLGTRPAPLAADGVAPVANGRSQSEGERLKVLLLTAADDRQGTSTVVANLAASLAEAHRDALVISADLRRPAVHRYLGAAGTPGLTDALSGLGSGGLGPYACRTVVPGVSLVPSGTPLDDELMLLTQAGPAIAEARHLADVVIIDTPPITAVSDASELVPFVDGVVLVCRASSARVSSARSALEVAARVGAPLVGVVLVGGKRPLRSGRSRRRATGGRGRPAASLPRPARVVPPAEPRGPQVDGVIDLSGADVDLSRPGVGDLAQGGADAPDEEGANGHRLATAGNGGGGAPAGVARPVGPADEPQ